MLWTNTVLHFWETLEVTGWVFGVLLVLVSVVRFVG